MSCLLESSVVWPLAFQKTVVCTERMSVVIVDWCCSLVWCIIMAVVCSVIISLADEHDIVNLFPYLLSLQAALIGHKHLLPTVSGGKSVESKENEESEEGGESVGGRSSLVDSLATVEERVSALLNSTIADGLDTFPEVSLIASSVQSVSIMPEGLDQPVK